MTEYIEREAVLAEYDRQHNGPPGGARKIIAEFPAADVVSRDCYNAILWENDVMRKQLAEIGKGFGQKMNGVAPVVRCVYCAKLESGACPVDSLKSDMSFCSWGIEDRRENE